MDTNIILKFIRLITLNSNEKFENIRYKYIGKENNIFVGPESIAKELFKNSFAFGGNSITLTDCAISSEIINFENSKKYFEKSAADKILDFSFKKITDFLDKILSFSKKKYKVIFVGGGSALFKNQIQKNKCDI